MKKTIRLSLIAASVLALTACNQEAKKEQAEVTLDTVEQQQAYGSGASVGNFLNKDLADKSEMA
jgi:Domain amino terminal to FKBP-type peptidyl-prolyl isomerase.